MIRLFLGFFVIFSLSIFSVGCSSNEPTTRVETRTPEEIAAADEDYESQMDLPDEGE
ncbi:hypothetical protein NHH03_15540 [Stieleria sp. TO1_6]|uniref:hypothetical protein n=1 Tax=Stieleria tagensis TaxID=2956795 RepID=UPI00209AF4EE|nr:hypothetical protein [Stieleria tagensis]MCO8123161.1 hypothetical protein [Stieleria tagensis]